MIFEVMLLLLLCGSVIDASNPGMPRLMPRLSFRVMYGLPGPGDDTDEEGSEESDEESDEEGSEESDEESDEEGSEESDEESETIGFDNFMNASDDSPSEDDDKYPFMKDSDDSSSGSESDPAE